MLPLCTLRVLIGSTLALAILRQASAGDMQPGTLQPVTLKTSVASLYGTLESPPGTDPVPVALIIAGSGPVDRDGNSTKGLNTDCYKLLAEALARRGIASLRYDKRGVGQSARPDLDERTLTFSTFVDDAVAWGRELRRDPHFSTLTIIGHSEGALIGLVGASRIPVDGVVSVSGAGEPLSRLMLRQLEPRLPPDAYQAAQAIITGLEHGTLTDHVPPLLEPVLRPSVQPYLVSVFRVDPVVEISRLKMPLLIVQGGRDLQVSQSDAASLAKGAPGARLDLIPEMNHVLKDAAQHDNLATYSDPTLAVDPRLVDAVSDFIIHLKRSSQ